MLGKNIGGYCVGYVFVKFVLESLVCFYFIVIIFYLVLENKI